MLSDSIYFSKKVPSRFFQEDPLDPLLNIFFITSLKSFWITLRPMRCEAFFVRELYELKLEIPVADSDEKQLMIFSHYPSQPIYKNSMWRRWEEKKRKKKKINEL